MKKLRICHVTCTVCRWITSHGVGELTQIARKVHHRPTSGHFRRGDALLGACLYSPFPRADHLHTGQIRVVTSCFEVQRNVDPLD